MVFGWESVVDRTRVEKTSFGCHSVLKDVLVRGKKNKKLNFAHQKKINLTFRLIRSKALQLPKLFVLFGNSLSRVVRGSPKCLSCCSWLVVELWPCCCVDENGVW